MRCPSCGAAIPPRSRCCGERISGSYPLTEVVTAVLFVAAGAYVLWFHYRATGTVI